MSTPAQTEKIQRIGNDLMLRALSASCGPGPATDHVVTEELVTASLSLIAAVVMLMKRIGVDDEEAKASLLVQVGLVFDAVHFAPRAVGNA